MTYEKKVRLVKSVTGAHIMDVRRALYENNYDVNDTIVWINDKKKSLL